MLHGACSKPHIPSNSPLEEDQLDLGLHVHPEEDVPNAFVMVCSLKVNTSLPSQIQWKHAKKSVNTNPFSQALLAFGPRQVHRLPAGC
mgnify:FL=1